MLVSRVVGYIMTRNRDRECSAYRQYYRYRTARDLFGTEHSSDPLLRTVVESWRLAEPHPQSKAEIDVLLANLRYILNSHGPTDMNPTRDRFDIDVFGSAAWGGGTGQTGDVDLVIIDTWIPQGYLPMFWTIPVGEDVPFWGNSAAPKRGPRSGVLELYDMRILGEALARGGMKQVFPIMNANTPIVKFQTVGNLQCDITMNDLGGWYNSQLILAYCNVLPHVVRPMIHALKLWAASRNVNNPSGVGDTPTMSSYCLTLMAIAYLQNENVLPVLQQDVHNWYPPVVDHADDSDSDVAIWTCWGRYQGVKAYIAFDREPPVSWIPRQMTAAQAIRGFFATFSDDKGVCTRLKYGTQFVSVLNGGICARDDCGGWVIQPKRFPGSRLVVQDPFLWEKNCAGGMSNAGHKRFREAVNATHRLIKSCPNVTLAAILMPHPSMR